MPKSRDEPSGVDFGVRVAALVERGGAVLLVRHEKPGREPYWVLPGGRLEADETIPECVRRELSEETNLRAEFGEVLHVSEFFAGERHTVDVTVRAVVSPDQSPSLGADPEVPPGERSTLKEVAWIERSGLEEITLLPPWLKRELSEPSGEVYVGGSR